MQSLTAPDRPPSRLEAVIFDMDGLLLDTERIYCSAITAAASGLGYEFPATFYQAMVGTAEVEICHILQQQFGDEFPVARLLKDCEAAIGQRLQAGVPVKAGVVELLDALAARGLPTAVATSTVRRIAERQLSQAGLLHRFAAVCTREDVARGKPHPDLFLEAAGRLGVPAQHCLVLEDSPHGIRAAHAAGALPVMVPDLLPATDELCALCVAVARDLHEVRAMLGAWLKQDRGKPGLGIDAQR